MSETRPTDQELSGMTVNERLFACGLLSRWDAAAKGRNREEMIAVLREVALGEIEAAQITDTVLKNPGEYGS
jgi:hypothetical protein